MATMQLGGDPAPQKSPYRPCEYPELSYQLSGQFQGVVSSSGKYTLAHGGSAGESRSVLVNRNPHGQFTGDQAKPTLLFICGMSGSTFLFRRFFPSLPNDWRVLAYEHCGADDASHGRLPIRDMARQALELLDSNGIASAIVCGESFGGPPLLKSLPGWLQKESIT